MSRNKHTFTIGTILIFCFYIFGIITLFLYSFTQVDLNLTEPFNQMFRIQELSNVFGRNISPQVIGYFNRPVSVQLYISIIILTFISYALILWQASMKKISLRTVWILIGITSVILFFSYPAFSYDLFNYIFDARIVTFYGENPYIHKALDYPSDSWLLFMRWTHRTYPYGPLWLGMTIPVSFLGFQKFIVTVFLFRSIMVISFIASAEAIRRILDKINPKYALFGTTLFALNPFVLTESIISAHNDIVMMAIALWSFYALIKKKYVFAILLLTASIALKFATVFLIPAFAYTLWLRHKRRKINWNAIIIWSIMGMIIAVAAATIRTQFQPWYLLYLLPFLALLPRNPIAIVSSILLSIGGVLYYIPYLYLGNWDLPVPMYLSWIRYTTLSLIVLFIVFYILFSNKTAKPGASS